MYCIIGKTGYIAKELIRYLESLNFNYLALSRKDLDYYHYNTIKDLVINNKISVILNCAGFIGKPSVDVAEIKKEENVQGNLILPIILNQLSMELNIDLVHISTGCIYQGDNKGKGWSEQDLPNFTLNTKSSFYSGIKWEAEKVIHNNPKHYIFRLRMPFNSVADDRNLITKLNNYEFIWNDWNSFTEKHEFVKTMHTIIQNKLEHGTYNICNPNPIFTKDIISLINKYISPHKTFKYFENMEQFFEKNLAPRSNCIMNTDKLKSLGLDLSDSFTAMEKACKEYKL